MYIQEINKADGENISYIHLAALLQPFLHTLGNCKNRIMLNRIVEKVFGPVLENNVTPSNEDEGDEDTEDSSSEINYDPKKGKWVDGGKLHPKTQKEV